MSNVAEEARAVGVDAFATEFDLKEGVAIDGFVAEVLARFGHIDILVNNRALMGHERVPMPELDEEVWREFFEINVHAAFHLTRQVAPGAHRGSAGRRPARRVSPKPTMVSGRLAMTRTGTGSPPAGV